MKTDVETETAVSDANAAQLLVASIDCDLPIRINCRPEVTSFTLQAS